jgi:hypothetical protein
MSIQTKPIKKVGKLSHTAAPEHPDMAARTLAKQLQLRETKIRNESLKHF